MTQRLNCYNLIPKLREHPGWGLDKGVLLDASAVKALFKREEDKIRNVTQSRNPENRVSKRQ